MIVVMSGPVAAAGQDAAPHEHTMPMAADENAWTFMQDGVVWGAAELSEMEHLNPKTPDEQIDPDAFLNGSDAAPRPAPQSKHH